MIPLSHLGVGRDPPFAALESGFEGSEEGPDVATSKSFGGGKSVAAEARSVLKGAGVDGSTVKSQRKSG